MNELKAMLNEQVTVEELRGWWLWSKNRSRQKWRSLSSDAPKKPQKSKPATK